MKSMIRFAIRRALARHGVHMCSLGFRFIPSDVSQHMEYSFLNSFVRSDWPRIIVDIGANDGRTASNSYNLLTEQRWRGVLVEPNITLHSTIKSNLQDADYQLFGVAVSSTNGRTELRLDNAGDGKQLMASIVKESNTWFDSVLSSSFVQVTMMRLADLLNKASVPKDFGILSIDTEGHDLNVLSGLEDWRPRLIISEAYPWNRETYRKKFMLLSKMGYLFITHLGCNEVFIREDSFEPGTFNYFGRHL